MLRRQLLASLAAVIMFAGCNEVAENKTTDLVGNTGVLPPEYDDFSSINCPSGNPLPQPVAVNTSAAPQAVIEALPTLDFKSLACTVRASQPIMRILANSALDECLATVQSSPPTLTAAEKEVAIKLWVNADKGWQGMQKVANCYAQASGIHIIVEVPENVSDKFQQETAEGDGPDIFIWAHDRIGDWAQSGFIQPIDPPVALRNTTPSNLWEAGKVAGLLYGYPIAVEGSLLVKNLDLMPESSIDLHKADTFDTAGYRPLLWDYTNTYFSYGWLNAGGGYAFQQTASGWDKTNVGVNHSNFVKQGDLLRDLIAKDVMPLGVDYGVFDSAFKEEKIAMVINGPWAFSDYTEAGIEFSVHPYAVNGEIARNFSGVLMALVNANITDNRKIFVTDFIENYLLTESGLKAIDEDRSLGVPANIGVLQSLQTDKNILASATAYYFFNEPIPNIREMSAFWSNMGPALEDISEGNKSSMQVFSEVKQKIELSN